MVSTGKLPIDLYENTISCNLKPKIDSWKMDKLKKITCILKVITDR